MKALLLIGAVLLLAACAAAVAYLAGSREEAAIRAVAVGLLTLLVTGGGAYLVAYTRAMRQLADDVVGQVQAARVVHFKSGSPARFWESVGGKLFLTNDAIEFRANPMEWWVYRISIPLVDVCSASPCKIGPVSGGLKVERHDGTFELFTFGAAFDASHQWADAIVASRDNVPGDHSRPSTKSR